MNAKRSSFKPISFLVLLAGAFWLFSSSARAGTFTPPADNQAPRVGVGGASRGSFIPPSENSAPSQATGGASRGSFIPPSENSAPSQATGGAARGDFIPPSENSAPSQAAGGASRGSFIPPENSTPTRTASGSARSNVQGVYSFDDRQLSAIALLPDSFYGTTLSSHPTILAYVPASTANEAIFSLKDEERNMHYQMLVPLSGQSGIVAIALPEDAPPLEIDRNYQWYFALKLDGTLSPGTPFVDGWIERIAPAPDLARSLEGKSLVEQSSILAANGVWYDSISILVDLRRVQPTDSVLLQEWAELLDSVALSQLIDAPLTR